MSKLMVKAELPNHLRNLVRQARQRDVGLQVSNQPSTQSQNPEP
jgi:hypothetical protein